MSDTTFAAKTTPIAADWLQDVGDLAYKGRNPNYALSTGSANTYTVTLSTSSQLTSLKPGDTFEWQVHVANTGASTFTVIGKAGATVQTGALVRFGGTALQSGDLPISTIVVCRWDGTSFQLANTYNIPGNAATATSATSATSATTATSAATLTTPRALNGTNFDGSAGITVTPSLTNSLGADVALTSTASYFDGPTVAQGTSGTWLASGTVTISEITNVDNYRIKLWDGTTVIASTFWATPSVTPCQLSISVTGVITSPAGNIRISVQPQTQTTGKLVFNASGNSKDCTLTAVRVG